jgi:hypothetical protein
MEQRQVVLDLQQELRVSAQLIEQLAKRMTRVSKLICKMGNIHLAENEKRWTFPKNDYDWLSTWITTDQIAFKAQKDTPGGCRTMTKYLWKVEGDIYDAAHPRG